MPGFTPSPGAGRPSGPGALFEHESGPAEAQLDAVVASCEAHVGAVSMQLRPVLLLALDFVRVATGAALRADASSARRCRSVPT
jgi:hypothetical protein